MNRKSKIIILVSAIIALIIIGIAVYLDNMIATERENQENRLSEVYKEMMKNETYSISLKLDDGNQTVISRKGNMANIDTYENGTHTTNIIKGGDTYLLMYDTNRYYVYQNNEIQLAELSNELNNIIQSQNPEKGEEEIDGEKYKYEEYKGVSYFLMNSDGNVSEESTNTRFYFKGNDLCYIKTITEGESQLLQVNVSYNVDDSIFEIPSNFQEG